MRTGRAFPEHPPAGAIAVASWRFLFRNFRHALWLGWPYLVFMLIRNGAPLLFISFMMSRARTTPDVFFDHFEWFAPVSLFFNIVVIVLDPVLLCCLAVGWMRAITRGVSYKNHCSFREEWKLVFCCLAQMLGIYLWWYILTFVLFISGFGLLYLLSSILPQALIGPLIVSFSTIPSLLTAIMVLASAPLFFLAPSFPYFPAKANGIVISSNLGRTLFKGLSLRFVGSTAFAILPFGAVILLYFIGLEFVHGLTGVTGFYTFSILMALAITLINFLFYLVFCGVLSGYYLWVRENRMKTRRRTTVPEDPFSDEGWGGPIWEDFR